MFVTAAIVFAICSLEPAFGGSSLKLLRSCSLCCSIALILSRWLILVRFQILIKKLFSKRLRLGRFDGGSAHLYMMSAVFLTALLADSTCLDRGMLQLFSRPLSLTYFFSFLYEC